MTRKRTTKKDTPIVAAAGAAEATEYDPTDPDQNPDDPTVPWSKAWVAARMAHNDARYVRVTNDEDCCGGLRCMHYKSTVRHKVRGKGAPKSTGAVVSLEDATIAVRGLLKAMGRGN
jgi:hypothetical protein